MNFELFAGPGGASLGIHEADPDTLSVGVEWDPDACATRALAGMATIRADVSQLPTSPLVGKVDGVWGSPPCPQYSSAGKGAGLAVIDHIAEAMLAILEGDDCRDVVRKQVVEDLLPVIKAEWDAKSPPKTYTDAELHADAVRRGTEACLVLEPSRFARDLRPRWVACEQTPFVIKLWEVMARGLRQLGYYTWTGLLDTANYGVAQNRPRAILMAHLEHPVGSPAPTHCDPREGGSLFSLPTWVSMAERLGWDASELVGFPRLADDRGDEIDGYRRRDLRAADQPSFSITEKGRSWHRYGESEMVLDTGCDWKPGGDREDAQKRSIDEPSPSVTGMSGRQWHLTVRTGANSMKHNRNTEDIVPYERDADLPAPTVDTKAGTAWKREWVYERPATVVQGDSRVFAPGGHIGNDGRDNSKMIGRSENAIKVELEELAALQDLPDGFTFVGNRTAICRQIGNAVPRSLARAVVSELTR